MIRYSIMILFFLELACTPQKNKNNSQIQIPESSKSSYDDANIADMYTFDVDVIHGTWETERVEGIEFSLWLTIEDGILIGQYCAMNSTASRIDCGNVDDVNECFIKGVVPSNSPEMTVEIVSCRSLTKGTARIKITDSGDLVWTIVDPPGKRGIDYLAHDMATMHKTSIEY